MLIERVLNEVKWDQVGTEAAGRLVAIRKTEFEGKPGLAYTLIASDGRVVRFFGTMEINSKIFPTDIGSIVLIQLVEIEQLAGGRTQKHMKILVDGPQRLVSNGQTPEPKRQCSDEITVAPLPAASGIQFAEARQLEITDDDIPF